MRSVAVVVAITVALAGCSEGVDSAADPTVPTSASTSSTADVPNVSVIPEVIDEPYLNAVLTALDEVDGQATREIVASKALTPKAADLLNAIYSDDAMQLESDGWIASLTDDAELSGVRPSPGNRRTKVDRIIGASPSCIWLAVRRDYSARNFDAGPDRLEYVALEPIDRTNDPNQKNPTPWMITADGFRLDGTEPSSPCNVG